MRKMPVIRTNYDRQSLHFQISKTLKRKYVSVDFHKLYNSFKSDCRRMLGASGIAFSSLQCCVNLMFCFLVHIGALIWCVYFYSFLLDIVSLRHYLFFVKFFKGHFFVADFNVAYPYLLQCWAETRFVVFGVWFIFPFLYLFNESRNCNCDLFLQKVAQMLGFVHLFWIAAMDRKHFFILYYHVGYVVVLHRWTVGGLRPCQAPSLYLSPPHAETSAKQVKRKKGRSHFLTK